jgi:transposase
LGWVTMSERDLRRIAVLSEVISERRTIVSAASVLAVSVRHVHRLLDRFEAGGGASLAHRARGRAPNNGIDAAVADYAIALIREKYLDFGPTLAAEMLVRHHGLTVSRETLRKWMVQAGIWLSRKQRRSFHQPRLRREAFGELIQIDGSEHRWFEDRGDPRTLLVFIDDATGRLMQLRFVSSESTASYFEALQGYLVTHGCPVAFYSDKHTVFRVSKPDAKGGQGMTQFGRALAELNIEIICANSSQAKGRVERVNRTLQDRLVKELRLAAVTGMTDGNVFLSGFVESFNARFSVVPARPDNLHRPLKMSAICLDDILCHREQRYVGQQLTLSYERKRIMLERNDVTEGTAGRHVEIYDFADGRMEVRWRGVSLPYVTFDKDQRVSHTAIVENKRLGAALTFIKAQRDLRVSPPRVKTNSEAGGYQKNGRKPGRRSHLVPRETDVIDARVPVAAG